MLSNYIDSIKEIFNNEEDRYKCHQRAKKVLLEMIQEKQVLMEIIKKNFLEKNYWSGKYSTVIDLEIETNTSFSLIGHCFMPLPDRSPNISHQSIHHHGNLLLTTAAAFGEKYYSILFKKGHQKQSDCSIKLEIDKEYDFVKGDVEFIDSYQNHIVFIPENLLISFALWSTDKKYDSHSLKNNTFVKFFKTPIKLLLKLLKLSHKFGINNVEGFDYYPKQGKIYELESRATIPFPRPKENYIQNLFYILQEVGFSDYLFLENLEDIYPANDFAIMKPYIEALKNGELISDHFMKEHMNIENVNIPYKEIKACFIDLNVQFED